MELSDVGRRARAWYGPFVPAAKPQMRLLPRPSLPHWLAIATHALALCMGQPANADRPATDGRPDASIAAAGPASAMSSPARTDRPWARRAP